MTHPLEQTATPTPNPPSGMACTPAEARHLSYLNLFRVYLRVLDPREHAALRLVEVEGASYDAAGGTLGVSRRVIQKLLFAARRKVFLGMGSTLRDLPG